MAIKKHIKGLEGSIIDINDAAIIVNTDDGELTIPKRRIHPKPKNEVKIGNFLEVHCLEKHNGTIIYIADTLGLEPLTEEEIKEILKSEGII